MITKQRFSQSGHLRTHLGIHKKLEKQGGSFHCDSCGLNFVSQLDRAAHASSCGQENAEFGDGRADNADHDLSDDNMDTSFYPNNEA